MARLDEVAPTRSASNRLPLGVMSLENIWKNRWNPFDMSRMSWPMEYSSEYS
jgi:hypothetical protein